MYDKSIKEEELKNKVAKDFFAAFDSTKINDNIDFWICPKDNLFTQVASYLWAEAKRGNKEDILQSFVQLILTIGKKSLQNIFSPPSFLGAFDCEKIAFLPYNSIMHIFSQNDFNWNVRPSDHESKEFAQLYAESKSIIEAQSLLFYFSKDNKALKDFIKVNFILENAHINRQKIDKNNFVNIYLRWQDEVKECIDVNWEILAKKHKVLDADFYLADLLSTENQTLTDKLLVVLKKTRENNEDKVFYELLRGKNDVGLFSGARAEFKTNLKDKHAQFWNRYERPPKEEYWDYIIERRDLLVPQNLREYQGAFFTPRIWVEKSQEYLAKTLGESYQEEYYIWDLAAGTGNLLVGLSDKYKIYASTLYKSDVDVMIQRIQRANLNLLESNVFVFDFLNDALPCVLHKEKQDLCFNCKNFDENTSKIPKSLINILQDSKKREKLIIYINPPYAEASSYKEKSKAKVANQTMVFEKYQTKVGKESLNELFAQFFIRIHEEIPSCTLAQFSTLKIVQSDKFLKFRTIFLAKFLKGFIVPSFSFDNVNGGFPIGFMVWNLDNKTKIKKVSLDVFNENQQSLGKKSFRVSNEKKTLRKWRESFYDDSIAQAIAEIIIVGPTMQSNNNTFITTQAKESYVKKGMVAKITQNNLIHFTIYFAVRHSIPATWLNDRDQFLYPNDMWEKDSEFQNDCLVFTLFHGQNRISAKESINHFIPFSEAEVEAKEAFESHFMQDFIKGKIKLASSQNSKSIQKALFAIESTSFIPSKPLIFSDEAKAVFEAGRKIWQYYHQNFAKIPEIHTQHKEDFYKNYNPNASLYDIKGYFQGFKESKGKSKMNARSLDSAYNDLIADLRYALDKLAKKIEPKIYEYGFLLE
ncbi:hypothetical protein CAV8706_1589 [Campylobacter avium]|uniref:hypothetical protein n=1 Tax=Campylobacter avium TaxID=522485 RepID=UPI000B9560E7|nr:hypothetical protein [Campylobacter avium]OYD79869.1 hypothetical protein CAV8706_1589 [Campylobacter avium]